MTYKLSTEQSTLWQEGGFSGWRVEEDGIEDLDRQHVQEPTVVTLDDGTTVFWVTKAGVKI